MVEEGRVKEAQRWYEEVGQRDGVLPTHELPKHVFYFLVYSPLSSGAVPRA